jgi:hypothetical protein
MLKYGENVNNNAQKRQISLCSYIPPDKSSVYSDYRKYRVVLGNGAKASFTGLSYLTIYLSEINSQLNDLLARIIVLNSQVTAMYLLHLDQPLPHQKLRDDLQSIPRQIDLIYSRSHWPNGNFIIFEKMKYCIQVLADASVLLMPLSPGLARDCELRAQELQKQLMEVGKQSLSSEY